MEKFSPEEIKQMEDKAEEIMAETKETTEGEVDLKKMSEEREGGISETTREKALSDAKTMMDSIEKQGIQKGDSIFVFYREDESSQEQGEALGVFEGVWRHTSRGSEGGVRIKGWGIIGFEKIIKVERSPM